jgi:putative membrane protein
MPMPDTPLSEMAETTPTSRRRGPLLIEIDDSEAQGAADPATAPPVPERGAQDTAMQGTAMQAAARLITRPRSRLARLAVWVFGALFSFVLSVAAWDFVTRLFSENRTLGMIALALVAAAALVLLIYAARELSAFARLGRLDHLNRQTQAAQRSADLGKARHLLAALQGLYAQRAETAWGSARLAERAPEIMDADALLELAEVELLGPLDRAAQAEIEAAARLVATATAIVPLALADVATALWANLRLVRRIAEIYGGRAGALGSLQLLRRVFASLLAAGAVALGDDMIGSIAGGGLMSRLSRRFGEGVVNGALTARLGIAAMELCRPMPFAALARPGVGAITSRALAGLIPSGRKEDDATEDSPKRR